MRKKILLQCSIPLLLVSLSTFIFFLMVEIIGHTYFLGWKSLSPKLLNSIPYIGTINVLQSSQTPGLRGELQPNLDTYYLMVPLKTNSQGLRDKEYAIEKPPNTLRIAVIGDSFTFPDGVRIEDAYHSLLEKWFNEKSENLQYEFINFGVGGYDLPDYIATLQGKALAYHPDLILLGFCPRNDFLPRPLFPSKEQKETQPALKARASYSMHLYDNLHAKLLGQEPPPREGAHLWGIQQAWQPTDEQVDEYADFMQNALQTFGNAAKKKSIPVVLVNLDYSPISQILQTFLSETAKENDMVFFDVSQYFTKGQDYTYMNYRSDPHPNARAHRLFAKYLYDFFLEKNLLPTSPL
ncbi:hypothetical protein A2635_02930 [Candidatus Peribacteria bacterium RIFCSPHIGHO2_01_FULL_51_9]|nr:MAG: hypothetical protein A2635_02930 [Candidatus Peribacteria bacterium RIFCSPHIGHO2_01_FULL_51_9]